MDYKKCKEFRKRLKKTGKITDPVKRGAALSSLTQDMRQDGFDFPRVYRCSATRVMQLIEEEIEKSKNRKDRKLKCIWSCIKVSGIVLGVVASIITIIWSIIHFFL